jgi:hypothetical protein
MIISYHDGLQLHENRIDSVKQSDGMRHRKNTLLVTMNDS